MIQQFIDDIANLEDQYLTLISKNYQSYEVNKEIQEIKDTIKIFYDYCLETNDPLTIAIKYMMDYNKRPTLSIYNRPLWVRTFIIEEPYYWHLPSNMFDKMYSLKSPNNAYMYSNYSTLIYDLLRGLND